MEKTDMPMGYKNSYGLSRKILLTMKLTTILLVTGFINVLASNTYSQSTKVSIKLKNSTVEQVLNEIEKNSDYYFLFNQKLVDVNRKVNVNVSNKPIKDVLANLFENENVSYFVYDRQIILSPKENNEKLEKQQQKVTGQIKDAATGETLPGVNVVVEGTTIGAVTDVDGHFSIVVPKPNSTLVFSYVGYLENKVTLSGQTSLNVTLAPDIQKLEEVVVVGYGTVSKSNLTMSVSKIKPDDVPGAANNSVNQMLFGRAAGLQASQQSSEPGGNINLSIRGRSGNPLIVIDGVVVPSSGLEPGSGQGELNGVHRGGLADINPNDIESIEVLKDASAAIYGVAAADGVILITTKKGKEGKMNVTYDGSRSVIVNMPYLQPLDAKDYMSYYNQFTKEQTAFEGKTYSPKFTDADIQGAVNKTDWLKEVLRNGSVDNHNLTINGGSDKLTYYFSGNYYGQEGTMKNSDLTRYSSRMNVSYKLNKFLKFNTAINYNRNEYTNSTAGWQTGGSGTQGFGALQAAVSYPRYLPIKDADGKYSMFSVTGNPVSLLSIDDKTKTSAVMANFSVDVDIIPEMLSAKVLYGNNYESANRGLYIPSDVFWNQIYESRGTLSGISRQNQTMEGILNFHKGIEDFAKVDVMAGAGEYIYDETGNSMVASGMLDAVKLDNMGSAPIIKSVSSYHNYEKKRSYFTRGSFDVLDRYLLTLTYRYDGIDKFFPENKYAGFPSASAGWKISKESFMQNLNFIDIIKLRGSIGITGRPLSGSAAYGLYEADPFQMYFSNGSSIYTTYYQTRIDQPSLKWEKTLNTNVGLDFGFFNNRISGSFDLFRDRVTNLLSSRSTKQLSYIASAYENDGAWVREGYEFALKTVNVATKDFQWDMIVNLSHYLYRWDKRYKNNDLQGYVGEKDPYHAIYVFETDGVLQKGETPSAWQPAKAQMPGAPKFVDRNGDGKLDTSDVVMYNTDPKFVIGFGNNFRYKQFDLGIFFYGQFGAHDYNYALAWADPKGIAGGTMGATTMIKDAWSEINTSGKYPGVNYNEASLGLPASIDTKLASKDFIRCRNITFGYNLKPSESFKYFSSMRIYVDVQNPFIITNYEGIDPEVQALSVKGAPAPYPMARTYSFGVNVNF
jgi:TonB-linked SusC/RagA family outer membrane protein